MSEILLTDTDCNECYWCGEMIDAGERYTTLSPSISKQGEWPIKTTTIRLHPECHAAWKKKACEPNGYEAKREEHMRGYSIRKRGYR